MQEPIQITLPTIFPMKTVNAWLFTEPEPILIDCGEKTDKAWSVLIKELGIHGLKIQDIKKVYITHAHVDHMGMAAKVAAASGAEIWVNELTKEWALDTKKMWDRRGKMYDNTILQSLKNEAGFTTMQQMMKGVFDVALKMWDDIPKHQLRIFDLDAKLSFGGGIWQSIYAPGHSVTQTMFYNEQQQWLLSADMILKITPTPIIDAQLEHPEERLKSLPQLLASYEKTKQLAIKKVFPGHYEPIENPYQIIDNQVNRIHKRKEQVLDLIEQGHYSFIELFKIMYNGAMNFPGMGMLIGYLDLLEIEGKIYRKKDGHQVKFVSHINQ